jgi:hypothetical protein
MFEVNSIHKQLVTTQQSCSKWTTSINTAFEFFTNDHFFFTHFQTPTGIHVKKKQRSVGVGRPLHIDGPGQTTTVVSSEKNHFWQTTLIGVTK